MRAVRNLGDLFPNLAVIRGIQLFKDFSVVIFDNEDLEVRIREQRILSKIKINIIEK